MSGRSTTPEGETTPAPAIGDLRPSGAVPRWSPWPVVRQIFIGRGGKMHDEKAFERKLYVIRRRVENVVRDSEIGQRKMFYVSSLSWKTLVVMIRSSPILIA